MKKEQSIFTPLHQKGKRDYVARVVSYDKAECAAVAKQFGKDYWDGDRKYGYGGYKYDGRWAPIAQKIIDLYGLNGSSRILDIGCGKAFLLHEIKKLLPSATIAGLDISSYAIGEAMPEVRSFLKVGSAAKLPFADKSFDLVLSLTTFHNLYLFDLVSALKEVKRVMAKDAFIVVESYRTEREKANLLYWQLTCESFFTPDEWKWLFEQQGYVGDYEFIYFE